MTAFVSAVCALFGLLVGSFLNVVIHRVPRRESVVLPRSRCPGCGTQLAERDNIPVLSWLVLRGRCRTCGMHISARYPIVELATALLFMGVGLRFGADWAVPAFLLFAATMLAVGLIDIEHFIVPNRIVLFSILAGVPLLVLAAASGDHRWVHMWGAALGLVLGGGMLLAVHLVSPRGMGMGDVKLAGVIGLFLGFLDVGHVLLGLFLGFLLGSVIGVLLIATKVRSRRQHIPFAPFLAAGALLALYVGNGFLDWYRG